MKACPACAEDIDEEAIAEGRCPHCDTLWTELGIAVGPRRRKHRMWMMPIKAELMPKADQPKVSPDTPPEPRPSSPWKRRVALGVVTALAVLAITTALYLGWSAYSNPELPEPTPEGFALLMSDHVRNDGDAWRAIDQMDAFSAVPWAALADEHGPSYMKTEEERLVACRKIGLIDHTDPSSLPGLCGNILRLERALAEAPTVLVDPEEHKRRLEVAATEAKEEHDRLKTELRTVVWFAGELGESKGTTFKVESGRFSDARRAECETATLCDDVGGYRNPVDLDYKPEFIATDGRSYEPGSISSLAKRETEEVEAANYQKETRVRFVQLTPNELNDLRERTKLAHKTRQRTRRAFNGFEKPDVEALTQALAEAKEALAAKFQPPAEAPAPSAESPQVPPAPASDTAAAAPSPTPDNTAAPEPTTEVILEPGDLEAAKEANTKGYRAYKQHSYEYAEYHYAHATRLDPTYPLAWYNLACIRALREDVTASLHALDRYAHLVASKKDVVRQVKKDRDFRKVRSDPQFVTWIQHNTPR